MSIRNRLRQWWQEKTGEEETPFDGDSPAFLASLMVHVALLLVLGLYPLAKREPDLMISLSTPDPIEEPEEIHLPEEVVWSAEPQEEIGANSELGEMEALSQAEVLADVSQIPNPIEPLIEAGEIETNLEIVDPTGLNFNRNVFTRGNSGEGATGAEGAVDRITHEILLSLEERKTLVVWLFDQSGSLSRQRSAIRDRFEKIYEELGVLEAANNPAFARHADKPLLTSVMCFGKTVLPLTPEPTDNLAEIKQAIDSIQQDDSGVEMVFSAVFAAAKKHTTYRIAPEGEREPPRNVMIVAFTDEAGDDGQTGMDSTIAYCRRFEIPVYVVGVPAPFGRKETMVKWVDPDPEFDQTPQWAEVDQGPESFMPERVKLTFGNRPEDDPVIDSGFGPFALTRLCYETGGIYFAVHPNRNVTRTVSRNETAAYSSHIQQFFDPTVMRRYRPEYVSRDEYVRRVKGNAARTALVEASQASWLTPMESPQLRFVKRSEPELATDLTEAQKVAAKLEPKIGALFDRLKLGEADRKKETTPRWQAGYDLAIGRVAAVYVRTVGYNAMLAAAKRGLKFEDEKNNTWILKPDNEVTGQLETTAKKAREYLERVVADHPGTPWAFLAQQELDNPLGWKWTEEFTDLAPRNNGGGGGNNNNPPNDAARMMRKPPPARKPPKL